MSLAAVRWAIIIMATVQDSEISWVHWDNLPETANATGVYPSSDSTARPRNRCCREAGVTVWRSAGFNASGGAQLKSEQWDEGIDDRRIRSRPDLHSRKRGSGMTCPAFQSV